MECKGTFFNRRIVSHAPDFAAISLCMVGQREFFDRWWSIDADTEFLLYSEMHYVTDTIKSYDGVNTFTMDWYQLENGPTERRVVGSDRPVVVIVHGLGGSSDEAYLKRLPVAASMVGAVPVLIIGVWTLLSLEIGHCCELTLPTSLFFGMCVCMCLPVCLSVSTPRPQTPTPFGPCYIFKLY